MTNPIKQDAALCCENRSVIISNLSIYWTWQRLVITKESHNYYDLMCLLLPNKQQILVFEKSINSAVLIGNLCYGRAKMSENRPITPTHQWVYEWYNKSDIEVSWIAGIYFFKEGQWCLNLAKTSFLEVKLQSSEIHLQQQMHDTSKERLKNNYWVLYNLTLIWLWCQNRKCNALIFLRKSVFFYIFKHEFLQSDK